jgi:quinol monooxygenase YgiN
MKRVIRYKVKADRLAENERHVGAVYEELRRLGPSGLRYATFRLGDGVSFMHLVSYENEGSARVLSASPAFNAFTAGIKDRCEEPPVTEELKEIGSYGFFDA